jgi:hypothetical protein
VRLHTAQDRILSTRVVKKPEASFLAAVIP